MADSLDDRLKPLRDAIDAVDGRLVELLNERARVASEVGRIKHEVGAPVFRPEREAEVLRKVRGQERGSARRGRAVEHLPRGDVRLPRART